MKILTMTCLYSLIVWLLMLTSVSIAAMSIFDREFALRRYLGARADVRLYRIDSTGDPTADQNVHQLSRLCNSSSTRFEYISRNRCQHPSRFLRHWSSRCRRTSQSFSHSTDRNEGSNLVKTVARWSDLFHRHHDNAYCDCDNVCP